ncbi:MAG: right-handed parallel beta-helix repeat-containing protein [Bacteroidota bacterium]
MKLMLQLHVLCLLAFNFITDTSTCQPGQVDPPSYEEYDLDLSNLNHTYISLKAYQNDTVIIGGVHEGDRIVLRDAEQMVIQFRNCLIRSSHPEDALVFQGPVLNTTIDAKGLILKQGGLTFWDQLTNVSVQAGTVDSTHTGIRATKDLPHSNITIEGWSISNATHEGIYLGVSKDTPQHLTGVFITQNKIRNCGWDGIQVGNSKFAVIFGNSLDFCGIAGEYGQDYGITINPGSLVYLYDNTIRNTLKPVQVLDSRAFLHAPPKN